MSVKRVFLTVILIKILLLSAVLLLGCEAVNGDTVRSGVSAHENAGSEKTQNSSAGERNPSQSTGVAPVVQLPEIDIPTAPGTAVEENDQAIVDFSNMHDGYIMAKYIEDTDANIRLLITVPDGVQYTYVLTPGRDFEVFPLSGGNGTYEIGVFIQVEGGRYSMVISTTIDVELVNEFAPFLRPNQFVNFNQNSNAVRKAAELTQGLCETAVMDRVAAIYNFVITNITYDKELAETVQSGYVPDIDEVLRIGKGICFDYAALMTAMLRSQGIPTKLVIGYTGELYHAWISVYTEESGWVDNVIFFDGNEWQLVDPTVAANVSSASLTDLIGDGTNYRAKFFH